MASNKSVVASKKNITTHRFLNILKNNKELISLKKELNNTRIRCKLLWHSLVKLNEQIDNFEELYSSINSNDKEKLLSKLLKESHTIYKKYIECGEIENDFEDTIEEVTQEVTQEVNKKYNIIDPPVPIMYISKHAEGIKYRNPVLNYRHRTCCRNSKNKKCKKIKKNKSIKIK